MRCLLTALGSYGDVHPMVGLGVALAGRGHDVRLITNPYFEEVVRGAGLRFVGVSTREAYEDLTRRRDLWRPRQGLDVVFRHGATTVLEELYDAVAEHYRGGETVIAAHGLDLASRVAAESLGAPVASIVYAPMVLWSDRAPPRMPFGFTRPNWLCSAQFRFGEWAMFRRLVRAPLDALRRRVGLGPLRQRYFDWYYGVAPPLCLFPDWFAPNPGDWPAGTETTGFPLWDGGVDAPLSGEVERFLDDGAPPLAFTPGSANRQASAFFASAAEACERLGRRGVLLTKYPEQLPARLPTGVRAIGFAPLSRVLPRAAAFVYHGGIGSCAQALSAGVPQLVQPLAFDQRDNALRLRRLGVAEEILPNRFRGEAVAAALGRLLSDDGVAERCESYSAKLDRRASLASACDRLVARVGQ